MAARAKNSVTASVATGGPASPGTAMGGTRHTHSGSTSSGIRLVTRTRRSAARPGQLAAGTTDRFQHVLAVIDHQQRPAARHRVGNSVKSRRRLGPPDPHPLNQGGNHLLIGATWHQVDVARQLRPARRHLDPCRLNRQSGLPDPPDADQRHHRIASQPGRDLPELRGSPDKRQTASAAAAPPPGPGRHHHHDRRTRRKPPHQPTVPPCSGPTKVIWVLTLGIPQG